MYAVIKTGGKQYRVKAGDLLVIEKLEGDVGANVAFDEVLMLGEGADVIVGAPTVAGAVVNGTLIETRKGDKIKVFKKTRRKGYRRTNGHRQLETVVRVTGVTGEGVNESWDGVVDLTPRSVLNARARNLRLADDAPVAVAEAAAPAPTVEAAAEAPAAKPKKSTAKAKAPKAADASSGDDA